MIQIKNIGKHSGKATQSKVSSGGFASSVTNIVANETQGVNIWGQYHDHTGDVDGDMMVNGSITVSADIVADGDINCSELIATEVGADSVTANRVEAITSKADNLLVNNNATVGGIIYGDDVQLSGDIHCADISCNAIDGYDITTEFLTVTKQAHFFSLIIDEIKSVGGQIILSAGNATVDYVEQVGGQYILYWRKDDGDSKGISNQFKRNDQIICQTFNMTDLDGEVENKYYWAVVTTAGYDTISLNGEETECNYIALSPTDFDGASVPEAGDKICQLGYRGTDDPQRQSAIILSAYKSPDPNVNAPSIVQYKGINSFTLDGCIVNQMSPDNNIFTGDFKVENNGTITDVVDLIQGQHPQVITDSEQAWIMADSNGKTYYSTDYQNLPTVIQAYLGSEVIPYSEWVTGSQIKYNNRTYKLTGTAPSPTTRTGLGISSITRNTNDVTIGWSYTPNASYDPETETTTNSGTTESNKTLEITIVFTHNGTTYTVTKNVPFNMIKASAVTQGADAEFDKLMVDKLDLTVTLDNKLTSNVNAKVYHIKGNSIEQQTDLTDYTANILLSNNITVSLSKSTYFYRTSNINNSYSSMTNPPTSATLRLYKSGTLVDEVPAAIKFNAGAIFTITDNAITSAVQQAQTYTDGQITTVNASISQIEQTANSISSRVTSIENDYVTSSELTQTANNIQLNVYDDLKNKTGIDISQGQITLNGNTVVNGNLSLTDQDSGFSLIGDGGITQIMPQSIGTYEQFTAKSSTTLSKSALTDGLEMQHDTTNYQFSFHTDFTIGVIKSDRTITISPYWMSFVKPDNTSITNWTVNQRQVTIYEDGVSKMTTQLGNDPITYTSQGGNVRIQCNDTVSIPSYYFDEPDPTHESQLVLVRENITIRVTIPNDAFMLIGYDGLAVNFGTSATAYIGTDSTTIKYGQHGIKVSNNGLQKWNGSSWVGINSKKVITMTTDQTLTNEVDLIVYNSATQRTLTLPNNLEVGKTVYIKKLGSTNLKLQSSSSNIYVQNSTTGTNTTTVSTFVFLVWDGSHWLLGYVG